VFDVVAGPCRVTPDRRKAQKRLYFGDQFGTKGTIDAITQPLVRSIGLRRIFFRAALSRLCANSANVLPAPRHRKSPRTIATTRGRETRHAAGLRSECRGVLCERFDGLRNATTMSHGAYRATLTRVHERVGGFERCKAIDGTLMATRARNRAAVDSGASGSRLVEVLSPVYRVHALSRLSAHIDPISAQAGFALQCCCAHESEI